MNDPTLATSPLTMIGRPGYIAKQYDVPVDTAFAMRLNEIITATPEPHLKTKLYLAGPMRGYSLSNFPAFDRATEDLRDEGFHVLSPAEVDRANGFSEYDAEALLTFDLESALADDLVYVCKEADGLAMLPGWEQSMGARAEVSAALALSKPVKTVKTWLGLEDVSITSVPQIGSQGRTGGALLSPSEMMGPEIRYTSDTGGQKGRKPVSIGSADVLPLVELAKVNAYGAQKYAAYNYLKGYNWSDSYDALDRHLKAFWLGEDDDPESHLLHLAHAMWHCAALISFLRRGLGTDDRYKQGE